MSPAPTPTEHIAAFVARVGPVVAAHSGSDRVLILRLINAIIDLLREMTEAFSRLSARVQDGTDTPRAAAPSHRAPAPSHHERQPGTSGRPRPPGAAPCSGPMLQDTERPEAPGRPVRWRLGTRPPPVVAGKPLPTKGPARAKPPREAARLPAPTRQNRALPAAPWHALFVT